MADHRFRRDVQIQNGRQGLPRRHGRNQRLEGRRRQRDVLIQFDGMPTAQHHQAILSKGGKLKASFAHLTAASYTVPADVVSDIAQIPGVTYVSPDRQVEGQLDYTAAAVNAAMAWKFGWSGNGVGI